MSQTTNILEVANKIVNHRSEEADRNYGPFSEGMVKTAQLASIMSNKKFDAIDAFNMLTALKLSRESYCHKEDNLLDLVAYVGGLNNYHYEKPVEPKINKNIKFQIYKDIKEKGETMIVRGCKTKEIMNYRFTLKPRDRFFNFDGRKMNLNYIKEEFKWYCKADRFDLSICDKAKMWKTLIAPDNGINSNYGQYIIPNFKRCANTLIKDKYSRRAIIMIGNNDNFNTECNDYCCTLSLSFSIRKNKLNMTVHMRSNDAIFGITNDVPTFSMFHEMMYVYLRDMEYKDLEMGDYTHMADSLHIYKRHYKMLNNILENAYEIETPCPKIENIYEVENLLNGKFDGEYEFSKWLNN